MTATKYACYTIWYMSHYAHSWVRVVLTGGRVFIWHQDICNCNNETGWLIHLSVVYEDVFKWKHSPRYWPFVRGIHRSPVNSAHKGQWLGTLMFSLICVWINGWVNNREAGDLRRYRAHYDVIVMPPTLWYGPVIIRTGSPYVKITTLGLLVSQPII